MDNIDFNKDPVGYLKYKLQTKATLKKNIWKLALQMFEGLKSEASTLISALTDKHDDHPEVTYTDIDQLEFSVTFGGDLLAFVLQTNIVTFDPSYHVMKSKSVESREELRYFAQIMIYNFMADTIKYNRTGDSGYLLARVLLNADNHFLVEGVRGLHYLFPGIDQTEATKENLSLLVKKTLGVSINNDLYGSDFNKIKYITLGKKLEKSSEVGHGSKIGFSMKNDEDFEG